jgi:transposase
MESCATSTYWAREIGKLGHGVNLIPPAYVRPYVRRQKNEQGDAAAICEAVSRPSMRFVAIKTIEQHATSELRTRAATVSYAARDREIYQMRITAGTTQGKRALRFR